ncbi:hypothetical protein OIU74_028071 [Salix koriyanagi]|uniref:Myb/SANT-like domain-containing protein n=1 Tax=Salix koriyanagi TaxID=2511006 RepID=A0A9Q0VBR4_9ROSI|nr:hypothetical protein OIU74_028071 [Salix koriyanagi]KAJ6745312.1 hypothetical protein OIU74_028071 [Salix koriyanagi]
MGTQIPTSNDRSRTYWTPTMERYFIDLMLEQLHRGNRIGHTFNKQAWTDMLAVFNAKFESQYDKDVLKSRYTNLWKQFNDVKELLGQTGFAWDENRQMVVADDGLWHDYIKVHPDARSYKTKAVLNFNDLCVIYGYTSADGRYSRSSHDFDFDDEVQGVIMGDPTGSLSSNSERPRTEWTAAMDQYFVELMLDQIGRGNKTDNSFVKQAWTDMLSSFNAKFGPRHDKRILRHRYKKLAKYYSDLKVILQQNGFSWDETQQMIVADDDKVWDAYIKAHPHARTYRMKTLPTYNDLVLIYGNGGDNDIQSNFLQDKDHEADISRKKAEAGKGSHSLGSSDRTRTYWTPPMDHYLIDLLLDQVQRGNKFGQTFISQAWIDMTASFNVKFQSHHDKDVLKNRYKHLRRLYNEIKNLLDNSGFSWDETREMITAKDHIWDAYIKAHPDARSYRVKTVPGYQKLCVIIGQENSGGRYSRLAQCIDANEEIPVLMTVDPLTVDWQPEMNRYFVDLMLEQVHGGNMSDHTFNEQAWANMVKLFNDKFGLTCDKDSLEKQYVSLMKDCNEISSLLSLRGFAWDGTQQMVTADDATWEDHVKEHPEAIAYKNKVLDIYLDLCFIQRNEVSDTRLGDPGPPIQVEDTAMKVEIVMDGLQGNVQFPGEEIEISDAQKKRPATVAELSYKAQKIGKEMQRVVSAFANKKESKNHMSIESAIETLQTIPDIGDELLLDACDLLEDERKAKTFLALDSTLRKKWLLRKLRPKESQ